MIKKKVLEYFNEKFVPKFDGIITSGLLLTLVIIFTFQGDIILEHPVYALLIAVPLVLQNIISAAFSYQLCKWAKLPHKIAAPASLIAASGFFELSVAVAISSSGPNSPAVLACTVGVLTEAPVMLMHVKYINRTKHWFPENKVQGGMITVLGTLLSGKSKLESPNAVTFYCSKYSLSS